LVTTTAAKAANGAFLTAAQVKAGMVEGGDDLTCAAAGITKPRPDLGATDIDGDGMPAGWEIDFFGDLLRDGSGDFDGDGLSDLAEFDLGTRPDASDTDQDGHPDGGEVEAGTDPLDPSFFPVAVDALDGRAFSILAGILVLLGVCASTGQEGPVPKESGPMRTGLPKDPRQIIHVLRCGQDEPAS
jgi:hypothetical protein